MVALATAATFAFATFAPQHERTHPSEYLGPFFRFTLVVIAVVLTILVSAFCMGITAPGLELHNVIGIPYEYVNGSGVLVGLALVDIGLLFLVAPTWAIVRKLNTPWVFSVGLRDLGKGLCLGTAILAVISGPVSVYSDSRLCVRGIQIIKNEPSYYLSL
jgi:hypothetical protein